MQRRTFLAGTGAALATTLARPAIAGKAKVIGFVPQADLTSLDPVWTTATVTRNYSLMVFETLYGRDQSFTPRPLMVEGHVVEDDGKRWTMRLREGMTFHDGTPVLARDCVASLQRWLTRDAGGATIKARLDALEAPDDRTIVFRLNHRFPALLDFLSKSQPSPVIMPARLAATDPFKQIPEAIGSGPFRFLPDERVTGSHAAFARFDKYVPRSEPASYVTGGHVVKVDRVEWRVMPDPATAAASLTAGEVDWVELPLPDLIPMLRQQDGVVVGRIDLYGIAGILRPNHIQGPTANPGVRRAMLAAIDQREVMTAVMGEDQSGWRAPMGFFLPGCASANDAGMEAVRTRRTPDQVRAMLKEAGYGGERVVLLHPSDQPAYKAMIDVVAPALRKVGINVDEQVVDWGTVVQRRTSKQPLDHGGWSLFPAGAPGVEYLSPLLSGTMRSNGAKAWFGWPDDKRLEAAYAAWVDADTAEERHRQDIEFQLAAFQSVPVIPLGQYLPQTAWRKEISAPLKGQAPVFWNISKE